MSARTNTAQVSLSRSWRPLRPRAMRQIGVASPASVAQARRARLIGRAGITLRAAVFCSVIIGAVIFAMTTDGGRRVRAAQPFGQDLDAIAEGLGLGLFQLSVTGQRRTPDSDIFDAAQGGQSHSLLFFDTAAARARIEALPWVAVARVRRVFPDELRVSVTEREPYARWRQDAHEVLLDAGGRLLGPAPPGSYAELPVVAGPDAASEAIKLLNELKRLPALGRRVDYAERVSARRWRLVLRDGRRIELPENDWARAMNLVVEPQAGVRLIDRAFATLDLRIPGQPQVRPLEPRSPAGRQ